VPVSDTREPGVEDATRRTRLANERTYLAWWRTGLTALAVAIGVGRIAPEVANTTKWPYEVLGVGYGVLGVAFMVAAFVRTREVERALDCGRFAPLHATFLLVLTAAGLVLGALTVVVIATVG
jgi:putative membrane protein